ncbi:alpha-L-glutamate ligase-like protein [Candidatus Poribacteria bacterium]|nr:alpha-L-glutamate ligase-like protein [Candidatus Poribacteria bacterium]
MIFGRLFHRVSPDVFGMNRRNRDLVMAHNTKHAIDLANDKIGTKNALRKHGIPTPSSIAEIWTHRSVRAVYPKLMECERGFVLKPCRGSQGRGVTLFHRALHDKVLPLHGEPWTLDEFVYQIARILSGEYTVGCPMDQALIEEKINPDREWIVPDLPGPPDLRIIVYRGEPVLCMARLPTIASEGRANLHKGGVGLGIDLTTGRSANAILREKHVTHHPDSGHELIGAEIEGIRDCMKIAALCAKAVPLGYMGVDIIKDKDRGPIVIEVNARPGLAIQLANRRGIGGAIAGRPEDGAA